LWLSLNRLGLLLLGSFCFQILRYLSLIETLRYAVDHLASVGHNANPYLALFGRDVFFLALSKSLSHVENVLEVVQQFRSIDGSAQPQLVLFCCFLLFLVLNLLSASCFAICFIVAFQFPSVFRGGERLSAKWRRREKDLRRINMLRKSTQTKNRKTSLTMRITREINKQTRASKHKLPNFRPNGKLRDPEPLVDILEDESQIIVVAEFAGFDRDDLKINARNQRLTLSAVSAGRKYHKSLNLPKRVIPNAVRTTFKNGVLEIQLKKAIANNKMENSQSSWIEHAN
jgi:HSP20 family molecular chaperone IbpA